MSILQTDGYFENPRHRLLEESVLFLLPLTFSFVETKANLNFSVKLAERSNHSFSTHLMNYLFQTSVFLNMRQLNKENLIDFVKI